MEIYDEMTYSQGHTALDTLELLTIFTATIIKMNLNLRVLLDVFLTLHWYCNFEKQIRSA